MAAFLIPTTISAQSVNLIDSTDILLTLDEVSSETGDPVDVTPAGATILTYSAFCTSSNADPYGISALNGGVYDPAANQEADEYQYDMNTAGTLTLSFTGAVTISSIAIYNAYNNRDDGTYTLSDAEGDDLGAYTILTPTTNGGTGNTDDFLLTFASPLTTTSLTIIASDLTDFKGLDSFLDIQVFSAVPEPGTYALLLLGLGTLAGSCHLRRRTGH